MSGFVYIWFDRKHKRYYVGSHWGREDDGYVCSSGWMKQAYKHRPHDFRRRILSRVSTTRSDLLIEEQRWLDMMKPSEMKPVNPKPRYYNIKRESGIRWHTDPSSPKYKTIGQKISAAKTGKKRGPHTEETKQKMREMKKIRQQERLEQTGRMKAEMKDEYKAKRRERTKKSWESEPRVYCPHCGIEGFRRQLKGRHFDNCRFLAVPDETYI